MTDFRRVGNIVPYGETYVGYDDVLPLFEVARTDVYLSARTSRVEITDDRTQMQCAIFLRSTDEYGFSIPNRSVSVKVGQDLEPNSLRLVVGIGSFTDEERHSKKQVRYTVETFGAEVLEAKKTVNFILGRSDVIIDYQEPQEIVVTDRKMYERPMQPEDCQRVSDLLGQAVRRSFLKGHR